MLQKRKKIESDASSIMKRSELSSRYRKDPSDTNNVAFKEQKNFCSILYKIENKEILRKLKSV